MLNINYVTFDTVVLLSLIMLLNFLWCRGPELTRSYVVLHTHFILFLSIQKGEEKNTSKTRKGDIEDQIR